jgi:hypothetical protein
MKENERRGGGERDNWSVGVERESARETERERDGEREREVGKRE